MGERVFKRGDIWYAWVPRPGGGVEKRSTNCTDKKAALVIAAKLERASVDPDYAAQNETETSHVLSSYLASRERLGRAEGTMHHVRVKSGHLLRLMPRMATLITHKVCEGYIDKRLGEGARRTTIKKELRVLKAALRLAGKNGLFKADPSNIIPELEDDYEPRTRFLEPWELVCLVLALGEDERAAMVALIVATGARLGEALRFQASDVVERDGLVFVKMRGTKTKKSKAEIPIVGPSVAVLRWALAHMNGPTFAPWGNVRRDLAAACKRAGIKTCSPNDLRRTMATWLGQAGVGTDLIWRAMRHVDGRMTERVYGQMSSEDLGRLITQRTAQVAGILMGGNETKSGGTEGIAATPDLQKPAGFLVPRDRIELPTRGFSSRESKSNGASKKQAPNTSATPSEALAWDTNGRSASRGPDPLRALTLTVLRAALDAVARKDPGAMRIAVEAMGMAQRVLSADVEDEQADAGDEAAS